MKKTHFVFASLIFALPAAVIAQQPDSKMSQDMNMSPASKEYMSGMQKMHSGMMNAMKKMAEDIIKAQKGEIEHMETWLKK